MVEIVYGFSLGISLIKMNISKKEKLELEDFNEIISELQAIADIMPTVEKILNGTQYE